MKTICVYGAASNEVSDRFKEAVRELGRRMAEHGYGLVYGGGSCGLMGAVAKGVAEGNGSVIGVVPDFMNEFEEINVLGETRFVKTLSERKDMMESLSDAFIVLPGGIGTMDEFFQAVTQNYLRRYRKPVILFNLDGFYDSLILFLQEMVKQKCLKQETLNSLVVANSVQEVMDKMALLEHWKYTK